MIPSPISNHSVHNPINHKDIIQNQVLILKQQKKRILDLVTQFQTRANDNQVIQTQIDKLLEKHSTSQTLKVRQQGWKTMTYIKQLQDQYSLTLNKLQKHAEINKSNSSSEQNIQIGDISLVLNEEIDLELRNRNSSMSSLEVSEISTDNDQIAGSVYSTKDLEKQTTLMVMSGLTMRKQKIGKYKIAETFCDNKIQSNQIHFIAEENQDGRIQVQSILQKHEKVQDIRKQLIEKQLVIPHFQRQRIWYKLIGVHFQIPSSYYQHLKQKVNTIDPLSKKLITADITRTFPEIKFFNQSPKMLEDLKMILEMFQAHNSSIGYVQGMAHIASLLLLVYDGQKAFECFNNLILGWSFVKNLYSFNEKDYELKLKVLGILTNQYAPKLYKRINNSQLELLMIQWFFSIFSRNFNINVAIKLWDLIFIHGEYMFYSISVAILKIFTDEILKVSEDQVYLKVKELTVTLDFQTLHREIRKLNLTHKDYVLALQRFAK